MKSLLITHEHYLKILVLDLMRYLYPKPNTPERKSVYREGALKACEAIIRGEI